jgi:hypothetical protein
MDITSLADLVNRTHDILVVSVRRISSDEIIVRLDAAGPDPEAARLRYDIRFRGVTHTTLSVTAGTAPEFYGEYEGLDPTPNQPLLSEYSGQVAELHFQSAPESPFDAYMDAYDALAEWSDHSGVLASRYLCWSPRTWCRIAGGGYGTLAVGPPDAMTHLAGALRPLMKVSVFVEDRPVRRLHTLQIGLGTVCYESAEITQVGPAADDGH